jgi:tRNA (guanosine-2'-O-)-methyltransferase
VHIIENENIYDINPDVALGSNKWLDLIKYNQKNNNTADAITSLKKKGYRVVATTPHTHDVNLDNFNLEKGKIALLFGTELLGLSEQALDLADEYVKIPMYGFTESFNISVSAAIILHTLSNKLRNSESINWHLTSDEKNEILLQWYKNAVKDSEGIIEKFYTKDTY